MVRILNDGSDLHLKKYEKGDFSELSSYSSELAEIVNESIENFGAIPYFRKTPFTKDAIMSEITKFRLPFIYILRSNRIEGFFSCYRITNTFGMILFCVRNGPKKEIVRNKLLDAVESQARCEKIRVVRTCSINDELSRYFEGRGFEFASWNMMMVNDLENIPIVQSPVKECTFRTMIKGEDESIRKTFHHDSPPYLDRSIFMPDFMKRGSYEEDWIHIAELKGEMIGIILTRPIKGYSKHFKVKRAEIWFPPIVREYRWKGFEEALLSRVLCSLKEKEMTEASVSVGPSNVGSFRYEMKGIYESLGFKEEIKQKFWKKLINLPLLVSGEM